MITFRHVTTGVTTQVPTPEEKVADVHPEIRDRVYRRQAQLIVRMDSSAKWQRVSGSPAASQDGPAPAAPQTNDSGSETPPKPATTPAAPAAEGGPKFTRVVTKTK